MFVDEKAVGEPQPVKVGTLKLSEAIRIGAKIRPKFFGTWFRDGRSCALGAAYEGFYGRVPKMTSDGECGIPADGMMEELRAAFPIVDLQIPTVGTLYDEIYQRNDGRKQTREEIADWLESHGY